MGRKPKAGVYEEAGQDSAEPEPTGAKENTGEQWHLVGTVPQGERLKVDAHEGEKM